MGSSLYGLPYAVAMHDAFSRRQASTSRHPELRRGGTTVRNILASKTPYGEVAVSAGGLPHSARAWTLSS